MSDLRARFYRAVEAASAGLPYSQKMFLTALQMQMQGDITPTDISTFADSLAGLPDVEAQAACAPLRTILEQAYRQVYTPGL